MRISDWSSDVCSSDLIAGQDIAQVLRVGGIGVAVTVGVGDDLEKAVVAEQLVNRCRGGDAVLEIGLVAFDLGVDLFVLCIPGLDAGIVDVAQLRGELIGGGAGAVGDRKSTRRTPVTNAHLVCRLLLEKKKQKTA